MESSSRRSARSPTPPSASSSTTAATAASSATSGPASPPTPPTSIASSTPLSTTAVWRPAEPWQPGATYQLTGTVTNPVSEFECAPEQLMLAADLFIDTAPAATLTAPEVSAVATVKVNPVLDLYNFACCAGAPEPTQQDTNCGNYINFDPELCAPTQGYGSLSLEVTATPDVYDVSLDPTSVQLDYVSRSVCFSVEALDLASGVVVVGEPRCFGEDLEDRPSSCPPSSPFMRYAASEV